VLRLECRIDGKEAVAVQKKIKHQMQLDYWRTRHGRPHIEALAPIVVRLVADPYASKPCFHSASPAAHGRMARNKMLDREIER